MQACDRGILWWRQPHEWRSAGNMQVFQVTRWRGACTSKQHLHCCRSSVCNISEALCDCNHLPMRADAPHCENCSKNSTKRPRCWSRFQTHHIWIRMHQNNLTARIHFLVPNITEHLRGSLVLLRAVMAAQEPAPPCRGGGGMALKLGLIGARPCLTPAGAAETYRHFQVSRASVYSHVRERAC